MTKVAGEAVGTAPGSGEAQVSPAPATFDDIFLGEQETTFQIAAATRFDKASENRTLTLTILADKIRALPAIEDKKDGFIIYPGRFEHGVRTRTLSNIEACTGAPSDFDGRGGDTVKREDFEAACREQGIEVITWLTHSAPDDPTGCTFRALMPYKVELPVDLHRPALAAIGKMLGMVPGTILHAAQGFFCQPRPGVEHDVRLIPGKPIDTLIDLHGLEPEEESDPKAFGDHVTGTPLTTEQYDDAVTVIDAMRAGNHHLSNGKRVWDRVGLALCTYEQGRELFIRFSIGAPDYSEAKCLKLLGQKLKAVASGGKAAKGAGIGNLFRIASDECDIPNPGVGRRPSTSTAFKDFAEDLIDFDAEPAEDRPRMSAEVREEMNRCISAEASLIEAGYSRHPEGGLWKAAPGGGITRATCLGGDLWATSAWSGIDGAACLANYYKGDELTAEAAWKEHARKPGGYAVWSSGDVNPATARDVKRFLVEAAVGSFSSVDLSNISRTELQTAKLSPRIILAQLLYADLRVRVAAGGVGKTTLAIYEAVRLALGLDVWGREPDGPKRTIFFSREDQRSTLVARLREIMGAMFLSDEQEQQVLTNIRIIDLSGVSLRLSKIEGDVVVPNTDVLKWIIKVTKDWHPDWLIFDPLVSFGVGESRVNDAEQGIVEAFRVLRNELGACIEGIHHTGKANARDKTNDQYSSRGGTALPDGSRMVAVLNPADCEEWLKETGTALGEGEDGIMMALPKLSYCAKQETVFIRRKGYSFSMAARVNLSPDDIRRADAEKVFAFIAKEYTEGRHYSKADLDVATESVGLSRAKIRAAVSFLKMNASVHYKEVDGQAGSYFEPIFMDFCDDENGEGRRTPKKDDTGMVCGA